MIAKEDHEGDQDHGQESLVFFEGFFRLEDRRFPQRGKSRGFIAYARGSNSFLSRKSRNFDKDGLS
jgi:hypothetical protein